MLQLWDPWLCSQQVPKPLDEVRIKRARDVHNATRAANRSGNRRGGRGGSGGGRSGQTRRFDEKNRPLKQNKNGVFVVDQKLYKASLENNPDTPPAPVPLPPATGDAILAKLAELESMTKADSTPASSSPAPTVRFAGSTSTPAVFTAKASELRALVHQALGK